MFGYSSFYLFCSPPFVAFISQLILMYEILKKPRNWWWVWDCSNIIVRLWSSLDHELNSWTKLNNSQNITNSMRILRIFVPRQPIFFIDDWTNGMQLYTWYRLVLLLTSSATDIWPAYCGWSVDPDRYWRFVFLLQTRCKPLSAFGTSGHHCGLYKFSCLPSIYVFGLWKESKGVCMGGFSANYKKGQKKIMLYMKYEIFKVKSF